jgi:hypothetical protein
LIGWATHGGSREYREAAGAGAQAVKLKQQEAFGADPPRRYRDNRQNTQWPQGTNAGAAANRKRRYLGLVDGTELTGRRSDIVWRSASQGCAAIQSLASFSEANFPK